MDKYDDVEGMLAMYVFYDVAKDSCDHNYAINGTGIRLKAQCHAIRASRIGVDHTTEGVPVSYISSSVPEAMVTELPNHAAASVV